MNAAVEVEGVTKRFGGTLALDDVSFSVRQGEVLHPQGHRLTAATTMRVVNVYGRQAPPLKRR